MADPRAALLDNDFLAQLERLSLKARRPVQGWGAGQRRSRRTGHSVEFADYRAYGSGDDMRYVDWAIYGRTDRMHVKLFVDDEDLCLHLLLDASASMDSGTPQKLRWAARLAAALGFIGLANQERVGLGVLRGSVGETLPPTRGRSRIPPLFEMLSSLQGRGNTSLNQSLTAYAQHAKGAGLAVLVSDLLDPAGYESGLQALLEHGFEVHVIHVLSEEELNPSIQGDLRLVDQESGEMLVLRMDAETRRAYAERLQQFVAQAERFCAEHAIGYSRVSSADTVEKLVLGPLRGKLLS
ncbi:MAG: DUF58 domain-containing protein [Burkholderiales bacterium]